MDDDRSDEVNEGGGDDDTAAFIDFDGLGVLSREAFQLHGHGVLNSIAGGHPGFVSDEYLNAIGADTTIAAAELEAAGIRSRRPGGYFVVADDMVKMAIDYNERTDQAEAECARRGRHTPPAEVDIESGWVLCQPAAAPRRRPCGTAQRRTARPRQSGRQSR